MAFNLPQFLRRSARSTLREYLRFRAIDLPAGFNWDATPKVYFAALRESVEGLSDGQRERVYQDWENADLLKDEAGQLALRSLFEDNSPFVQASGLMESNEDRSLAALMENEDAFRKALTARLADRLRTGRSWSGFLSTPIAGVRSSPSAADLAGFEADVQSIFKSFDGSGRRLSIDTFDRRSPNGFSRISQYTVSIEGLPQAINEFDAERLVARARRPVFEAALCYDPGSGAIDVVCKGGRKVRLDIARAFAKRVLGSASDPWAVRLRTVFLDGLKSRTTFPSEPSDGQQRVAVTMLRLSDSDGDFGRLTFEVGSAPDDEDIWTRSRMWFEDFDPLAFANWSVTQAVLRIEFHPEKDGGPAKALTVDLRTPHGTNLKDLPRRYARIIEENLLRWGLLQDATT